MRRWGVSVASLCLALSLLQAAQAPPQPAIFHSGTRLVEVEVVVRDQPIRPPGFVNWLAWAFSSGPPFGAPGAIHTGLTKKDFDIIDNGRPQSIAVFRTGPSSDMQPLAPAPGATSNRQDSQGQPIHGATAVFVDFLNTNFGCRGYQRAGFTKLLRSFSNSDSRIALYTLGTHLHVLQDFTDPPQKLLDTAAKLDQHPIPSDLAPILDDLGDLIAVGGDEARAAAVHRPITIGAAQLVIQHLAGLPGRKSLIYVMEDPQLVPPPVVAMAQRANIVLYPVLLRLVGSAFGLTPDESCKGNGIHAVDDLAALTGARAFYDIQDLPAAVHATEEDRTASYTLGYYPSEEMLDGRYHRITVRLRNRAVEKLDPEIQYRPGYLATKVAAAAPPATLSDLFNEPLSATGIGLSGQATASPDHPGLYDVHVTVDFRDIHITPQKSRFTAAFDVSLRNAANSATVNTATLNLDLTEKQLTQALATGVPFAIPNAEPDSGEIRVVVRDRSTGLAGSLRIPVPPPPPK